MRQRISPEMLELLDRVSRRLEQFMRLTLILAAVAVFAGAVVAIGSLSSEGRLERLLVAVVASLALGAIDGRYAWFERRRYLLAPEPEGRAVYVRYLLLSFGLVAGAAAVLIALAWFLP